ncbi:MAG: hypothetical protein ACHQII_08370 [Bacteroidia bacterium]
MKKRIFIVVLALVSIMASLKAQSGAKWALPYKTSTNKEYQAR